MNSPINPAPIIEKEQIPSFRFGHEDVLTDPEARKKRFRDLSRAASLGNVYQGKVEITFQTEDGALKRVATTVWTLDENYIILKASCALPIIAITGIEFF